MKQYSEQSTTGHPRQAANPSICELGLSIFGENFTV